jgi:HEAT repeat protein
LTLFRALALASGLLAMLPAPPAAAQESVRKSSASRRVYDLIDVIKRPRSSRQLNAAIAALAARGSSVTPYLLNELRKRDRNTYVPMVYLLGRVGDPKISRDVLWNEARRERGVNRLYALYALAMQGEVEAVRYAVRSTSATTSFVPGGTAVDFVAGVLGPAAVPVLLEELPRRAGPGFLAGVTALGTVADPLALPYLLQLLGHEDPAVVRVALGSLARIGDPDTGPAASRLLGAADGKVREAAAETLAYLKWRGACADLRRHAAEDSLASVRRKSVWALGKAGGPAGVLALSGFATRGEDRRIRAIAAEALGYTGSPEAVPPLRSLALGNDEELARLAVRSLSQLTLPRATDALAEASRAGRFFRIRGDACLALEDRDPGRAAAAALALLGAGAYAGGGPDPLLTRRLLRLVGASGGQNALRSLQALRERDPGRLPPGLLEPALRELRLRSEKGDDPTAWRPLLGSDDPDLLDLAVRRLGELGDEGSVEGIIRAFGRIDQGRAAAVPVALGRIGSSRSLEFLTSFVSDEIYATPSLLRARQAAAWALPRCGAGEAAATALRTMAGRGGAETLPALVALVRISGAEALPDLYEYKRLLLRETSTEAAERHESVNWMIRETRAGRGIDRLDRHPERQ